MLPEHQSGFRSGYNCTTALLNNTDDILRENDAGNNSALVLLDYSRLLALLITNSYWPFFHTPVAHLM
nr:unnamed protein product [Callosobruchus analis]